MPEGGRLMEEDFILAHDSGGAVCLDREGMVVRMACGIHQEGDMVGCITLVV